MKPTLEEIKDNYERVLLRLHYGCGEIIDWDWDINNPHDLKFKKGDKVRVLDSEKRPRYEQITNKIGKIVYISSYIDPYRHIENTNYYVEIPEYANEYQSKGWWVFKNANSLRLISDEVTYDDQMDTYTYSMFMTRYNMTEIDDIIKGDNKTMKNEILEIYEEKQLRKIHKKYDDLEQLIKQTDERYKVWLECTTTLDKLYAEDKIVSFAHANIELSEDTKKKLRTMVYEPREEELRKFYSKKAEVNAQLSMCETYDQKQEILRRYNIINKNGKVNG